ncbi:MAG TPA: bifunctional phosphoserine phosphatase/homoserine phosphotransferase ThrH [Nitrospirales bacterium]|nr:bifunctional phosphoserine phosphatase/homoserine phosphotransferase ThrH [Nitrospirales bacterium]HIA14671.1 bifunctional phosphoserine phosphatase/homoserine phosphotransferase ThrH [Nitrospirales bacterium]HIC05359.1 bifunctional phosphoserine phosphatase/homoserine phosphotransferase ThrH [Nitrospirales bacterium]HIN34051.1 bifunctional phosphoserine phosphatase/homoserine phosphotransferase ThrH [Nitrospirales bacterium]HIO68991.1 bifunctional phosphoserine phosphatase/homoserine phosph
MQQPVIVCLDLEGVLVPEVWISLAEATHIEDLRLTTRDISDYDVLMKKRLEILAAHSLRIQDVHAAVDTLNPLEGASEFLAALRATYQVVILSDTFYEVIAPLMKKLHYPTLFSHSLEVDPDGRIRQYHLRQPDQKRKSVMAFKNLNFRVLATGDSYNDTSMLQSADVGIFFRPTDAIVQEFPQFPVTQTYDELRAQLDQAASPPQ